MNNLIKKHRKTQLLSIDELKMKIKKVENKVSKAERDYLHDLLKARISEESYQSFLNTEYYIG